MGEATGWNERLPDGPLLYLGVGTCAFVAALLLWQRLVVGKPQSIVHMIGVGLIISVVVFIAMCIGVAISVQSFFVVIAFVVMPFTVGWKLALLVGLWGLLWSIRQSTINEEARD